MNKKNPNWALIKIACYLFFFSAMQAIGQEVTIIKNTMVGSIGEAQVEIECPDGFRLLLDVADPESLTKPVSAKDILLTTHLHSDHYRKEFCDAFPGKQLRMEKGQISQMNVFAKSIPASHSYVWPSETIKADDFIIIADIAGLRIAHLGDIEQKTLMPEQVAELQNIDIMITALRSSAIIDIINQVKPHIILPTHIWEYLLRTHIGEWPVFRITESEITLSPESLPSETTMLLVGDWAGKIGGMFDVPEWQGRN